MQFQATSKLVEKVRKSDMEKQAKYVAAGRFSSRGTWIHPAANNPTWEYILALQGTIAIEEEGNEYVLSEGDVLRLDRNCTHRGFAQSENAVSFFWLHFDCDTLPTGLPKLCRLGTDVRPYTLFRQLLHYANTPEYPSDAADCITRLILIELEVLCAKESAEPVSLYEQICEWCRINWDKNLTVADVSRRFGYNEDYLPRFFYKYGNVGLKTYIRDRKLEHIRAMLLDSELPLKQIALASGFEDYKSFLKYFRYHEKMSPTAYRNLYNKTHTNNH